MGKDFAQTANEFTRGDARGGLHGLRLYCEM